MINARGWIVLALLATAGGGLLGYRAGAGIERERWSSWTYSHVAWDTKGNRIK